MDNDKQIRREIRHVSNFSSLPVLVFTLLQLIIVNLFPVLIKSPLFNGLAANRDLLTLIIYTLIYAGAGTASLVVFYRGRSCQTGLKPSQLFRKPQKSAGWCVKWIIISASFTYLANLFTVALLTILRNVGAEINSPEFQFGSTPLGALSMIISVSVYAPFFEEMIFRGAVYRNSEIAGQVFAGLFSGVLFGLWHMNVYQLVFAAVMGCFSAFLVAKTRSIIPSVILHFGINTATTLIRLILPTAPGASSDAALSLPGKNPGVLLAAALFGQVFIGVIVAGIVMFIISLVKNRGRKVFRGGVFPLKAAGTIGVFLTAPVTVITLVILIAGTLVRGFF